MDLKHNHDKSVEPPEAKRQKLEASTYDAETREPLISEEQKFWTAIAEPPDIDYRGLIMGHTYDKKKYLEDKTMRLRSSAYGWY